MQEKHQAESESKSPETYEETVGTAEDGVKRKSANKSKQHQLIRNSPVAHIPVGDQERHRYEQNAERNGLISKHLPVSVSNNRFVGHFSGPAIDRKEFDGPALICSIPPVTPLFARQLLQVAGTA